MAASRQKFPVWICSQIGAREHYAIPRALQQAGRSVTLCTDFWAGRMLRKSFVGPLRPLGARCHPGFETISTATIKSWNVRALFWEKHLRNIAARQTPYHGFIKIGRRFAQCVRGELKRRLEANRDFIFFAYDTGALEALEWCRERDVKCILNQMDPNRVEVELVRAEEKQWPGWALQPVQVPEEYFARREREWKAADRVVVNSEFSRQALLRQRVPAEKLIVIPLCYEPDGINRPAAINHRQPDKPLRVLFLGQVILRKGIQYLLAAARQLERENIHFDVVGTIGISQTALATAPRNVTFHGRAVRDQAASWYRRSHVFVLPTLSDGFAITQLEAMAHGLPVIVTDCCGKVVGDGVDGFLIPARDASALAQTLRRFLAEPDLLTKQSAAALIKASQFTLDRLAVDLMRLESGLL